MSDDDRRRNLYAVQCSRSIPPEQVTRNIDTVAKSLEHTTLSWHEIVTAFMYNLPNAISMPLRSDLSFQSLTVAPSETGFKKLVGDALIHWGLLNQLDPAGLEIPAPGTSRRPPLSDSKPLSAVS